MSPAVAADQYVDERNNSRALGKRLTYDCMNAKVSPVDRRVRCSLGKILNMHSGDGSSSEDVILRGKCFSSCQRCTEFITESNCSEE
jgi:hypothetical protein